MIGAEGNPRVTRRQISQQVLDIAGATTDRLSGTENLDRQIAGEDGEHFAKLGGTETGQLSRTGHSSVPGRTGQFPINCLSVQTVPVSCLSVPVARYSSST